MREDVVSFGRIAFSYYPLSLLQESKVIWFTVRYRYKFHQI